MPRAGTRRHEAGAAGPRGEVPGFGRVTYDMARQWVQVGAYLALPAPPRHK